MNVCVKCKDKGEKCRGNCTVRNPQPDVKRFKQADKDTRFVGRAYPDRGWLLEPCRN